MAATARPAWVDDELFPFKSRFVAIDGHTVHKERQRWEQVFADHHTVIVDGAGHFVQSDAPEEFAAAIRDWPVKR